MNKTSFHFRCSRRRRAGAFPLETHDFGGFKRDVQQRAKDAGGEIASDTVIISHKRAQST
jgi:hypothetical protein